MSVRIGYAETGLVEEFKGWLQSVSTDGGSIRLMCEDDLFTFRKSLGNVVLKGVTLASLLDRVIKELGLGYKVSCSYSWTYSKFVINNATGYDVLKKVQDESGADIYLKDGVLHIHPPGEVVGEERIYDFMLNVEEADLTYRKAEDKKIRVVVKALMPDGTVKELETGSTGGDKVEVKCPTSDEASMKARGELEVKRRSFDGYDGSLTTWLIPECRPGDSATLHDGDYPGKDGTYFIRSVTTSFSKEGGKRKIELGFRLS
ncbi:hypothetical protein [Paraprevotella clara]|uniref:hypothetical protein n=1 Tax=Paraprevotella clara TaxID=454154 RepID=UPI0040296CD6